jgi:hypothetical protein
MAGGFQDPPAILLLGQINLETISNIYKVTDCLMPVLASWDPL